MKKLLFVLLSSSTLWYGCTESDSRILDERILSEYIAINEDRELDDLIACAAGKSDGFPSVDESPTSVFFYPIAGATDFRYFEAEDIADSLDFSKYVIKELVAVPVFNGYLWKFNNTEFEGERMGVVSYKTDNKLHVCTPIRLKTYVKPTEINNNLLTVSENGVSPQFTWQDGSIIESVIYFQVISDSSSNLVSGTYTYDKVFTFYDLENVVLNISPTNPVPSLSNGRYTFTMMGVSEDNWVNLLIEQDFEVTEGGIDNTLLKK